MALKAADIRALATPERIALALLKDEEAQVLQALLETMKKGTAHRDRMTLTIKVFEARTDALLLKGARGGDKAQLQLENDRLTNDLAALERELEDLQREHEELRAMLLEDMDE